MLLCYVFSINVELVPMGESNGSDEQQRHFFKCLLLPSMDMGSGRYRQWETKSVEGQQSTDLGASAAVTIIPYPSRAVLQSE